MLLRPLSRAVTRPLSFLALIAWAAVMAVLVNRSYIQASSVSLATDLARYGSSALWRGVYYRGEKIGFTVSQTVPEDGGFGLEEDGRLQMSLLGATTAGTRSEERELDEPPALSQNLSRRLANGGLVPGARYRWTVFDPATLRNAPVTLDVGKRELVRGSGVPLPAFRVEMEYAGLRTT